MVDKSLSNTVVINKKGKVKRYKYLVPKLERLFKLLEIVRLERNVRADYIAKRLGVNVRQVYRYVASLKEAGVPIVYNRIGGYKLSASFYIPPINLTENEMMAIFKGLNDQNTHESRIAWLKISTFFPRELVNRLEECFLKDPE